MSVPAPTSAYPEHWATDVVLRDGSTIRIRPARDDDIERLEDYLIGLSEQTRQLRFWSASIDVRETAVRAVDVDHHDHVTLLALHGGDEGTIIAGAQYIRIAGGRAEVSMSVADAWQGRGVGSILLAHVARAAAENDVTAFVAEILPENHRMINLVRRSGFTVSSLRAQPGNIEVEFPTALSEEGQERYEERGDVAAVNAIRSLLSPVSVAVIGASREPASIGGTLFDNLISARFRGPVYPVNPSADVIHGVPCYASVRDIPGPVETAFIVVPARYVPQVAQECGETGVRGLVVISAGFAETGGDGPALQEQLVQICRAHGMRLIGPNCMGIVNTSPEIRLNGTFATVWPPAGRVGFLSQSGALGLAVMQHAANLGLGLSSFVSIGNKADISGNDLVCYWDADEGTDVILLYLESFGNPRRFARLARHVAKRKPIVAVKSGRSQAGQRAAASHTGSLLAASDITVDALFHQSGVIRTDTLEEMFDVATLLANQLPPSGDRVGIVTNAGGLGILCADTCEANGLKVQPLSEATAATLRGFLPAEASVANPVDMIASAKGDDYARAIRTVAEDPEVNAVIVIYIPPLASDAPDVARGIVEAYRAIGGRVPVLTTFMSAKGLPEELRAPGVDIPSFAFPEDAAIALARAARYGEWRLRPEGAVPVFADTRPDEAAGILAAALDRGEPTWLEPDEVERLLGCYGLPIVPTLRATRPEEAAAAATELGGTVALKAVGPAIIHKTEVGAVRIGLTPQQVEAAATEMTAAVASEGLALEGFVVQPMIEAGVEMLVGVVHDRLFGPVVACGAGGTAVELVKDVAVRIAPLSDLDASEMIRSLATFPLLDGYRGAERADVPALEDVLLRVSALVETHPEIAEMDCNPVMVMAKNAAIIDARVRVESPPPRSPQAAATT